MSKEQVVDGQRDLGYRNEGGPVTANTTVIGRKDIRVVKDQIGGVTTVSDLFQLVSVSQKGFFGVPHRKSLNHLNNIWS